MVKSFYGILTALAIDPEIGLLFVKQLKQMKTKDMKMTKSPKIQHSTREGLLLSLEHGNHILYHISNQGGQGLTICIINLINSDMLNYILFLDHQHHQHRLV